MILELRKRGSHPLIFVSVASKGFRFSVSRLFAILAGRSISVAFKRFTEEGYWRKSNGLGWENLGWVRRTAWLAAMVGGAR
jgi:hypothetical protein